MRGPLAQIDSPMGCYLQGNLLYFTDAWNNRVRFVDLTSNMVHTIAGNGENGRRSGKAANVSVSCP